LPTPLVAARIGFPVVAKSDDTLGRKERGDRKAASFFVTRPLAS
jgi:hypothetical protein